MGRAQWPSHATVEASPRRAEMPDLPGRGWPGEPPFSPGAGPRQRRYGLRMADGDATDAEAGGEQPPKLSRRERREQKRRQHEAQKKAKAIDKANDRRARMDEKKNQKDFEKAAKKADKGKQEKANKKTDKIRRRRERRRAR